MANTTKSSKNRTAKFDGTQASFTKHQQNEYSQLTKNFNLTPQEYIDIKKAQQKANYKSTRLEHRQETKQDVFLIYHFNRDITSITSRERYDKRIKFLTKYNSRDFVKKSNRQVRENLYETLKSFYGKDAQQFIKQFEKLSDKEYYEFFEENDALKSLGYDSDQSLLLDKANITSTKLQTLLNEV